MMMLEAFKSLLGRSRAFNITPDKKLRQLFGALAETAEDTRSFYGRIFDDIDPFKTRRLAEYEQQFGLTPGVLLEAERRSRLDAEWKARGGQSPSYIQATLRAAGFDVYVHEWWQLVNGEPVARDPRTVVGSVGAATSRDGVGTMRDGNAGARDGAAVGAVGRIITGLPRVPQQVTISDGNSLMRDGNPFARDGGQRTEYIDPVVTVPDDPDFWPYFLYIGGQTFPNTAQVPTGRREELETLCLKICPAEQYLAILVDYN